MEWERRRTHTSGAWTPFPSPLTPPGHSLRVQRLCWKPCTNYSEGPSGISFTFQEKGKKETIHPSALSSLSSGLREKSSFKPITATGIQASLSL